MNLKHISALEDTRKHFEKSSASIVFEQENGTWKGARLCSSFNEAENFSKKGKDKNTYA